MATAERSPAPCRLPLRRRQFSRRNWKCRKKKARRTGHRFCRRPLMMLSKREGSSEAPTVGGRGSSSFRGTELRNGGRGPDSTGQRPNAASDARRDGSGQNPVGINDSGDGKNGAAVLPRIPFDRV